MASGHSTCVQQCDNNSNSTRFRRNDPSCRFSGIGTSTPSQQLVFAYLLRTTCVCGIFICKDLAIPLSSTTPGIGNLCVCLCALIDAAIPTHVGTHDETLGSQHFRLMCSRSYMYASRTCISSMCITRNMMMPCHYMTVHARLHTLIVKAMLQLLCYAHSSICEVFFLCLNQIDIFVIHVYCVSRYTAIHIRHMHGRAFVSRINVAFVHAFTRH